MQLEVIGIVLLICPRCNEQHVASTESIQSAGQVICKCGYERKYHPGTNVCLTISDGQAPEMPSKPDDRYYDSMPIGGRWRHLSAGPPTIYDRDKNNEAMVMCYKETLKEYKRRLKEYNQDLKEYNKEVASIEKEIKQKDQFNHALSLDEYRALLANMIVTGKKPKVQKKNSNTISFNDKSEEIRNNVEALIHLGYKEADALRKVNVEAEQGFFSEDAIVKKILTM